MMFFSLFSLTLCLIYTFVIFGQACTRTRNSKNDMRYYSVRLSLQRMEGLYYYLKSTGVLDAYPKIMQYLNQVTQLLDSNMEGLRNARFVSGSSIDSEYIVALKDEILKAPENIRNLVFSVSSYFEQLVEIQHPIQSRLDTCKKRY